MSSRALAILCLLGATLGSCAPIATQLVVVLRSEVPINQMRSIDALVFREGSTTPIAHHTLAAQGLSWPLSFGVVAANSADTRAIIVIATLNIQDGMGPATIQQAARVRTIPSKVLQLDLTLNRDCVDRPPATARCTWPQTCAIGACVGADRTNLPELTP